MPAIYQVIFDLSKEYIHITLIDGSRFLYSFAQYHQILDFPISLQAESTSVPSKPSLCSKFKLALFSHLDTLLSFLKRDELAASDLNQLCRMPIHQLAILKKKVRPCPLTPTEIQVALDHRRSQEEKAKPIFIKNKIRRKKPSSTLGGSKNRKRNKSAPTPETENLPASYRLPETTSALHLEQKDLHQLLYHLTAYRSTLVDFFQSVVLNILKAELPQLYSIWVLKSQIQSLRKSFKDHSLQFVHILQENQALENFQQLHSAHDPSDLLREMQDWCQTVAAPNPCDQDVLSSADTTLTEPSLTRQNVFNSPFSSPGGPKNHTNTRSKHGQTFSQDTLPHLPVTSTWSGIRASPCAPLSNHVRTESLNRDDIYRLSRQRTPSLSPPPGVSPQSRFSTHSNLQLPLLVLEQGLLSSIQSEKPRQSAIELGIKLAEGRLEIDKLEENCFILKLLEEERQSRDEFSGISRLSDIITTSRLSVGLDGSEANIAQHATIKGALASSKAIPVDGSSGLSAAPYRPPSKSSELKRRQCIKRKTWLAATRRLDCRSVGQHAHDDKPSLVVWPEPIFLKSSIRKRRQDEIDSVTAWSLQDGLRLEEIKRRKCDERSIGELRQTLQDGKPVEGAEASSQAVVWVQLDNNEDGKASSPILVSSPISSLCPVDNTTDSVDEEQAGWLVSQGVISEVAPSPSDDDEQDGPSCSSRGLTEGLVGEDLSMDNMKLFTKNEKVYESLSGESYPGNNLSEADSEWPR
ncbi:hypothetical protein VP01_1653g7 [Puccinia sorghi]|uniref:Uncharacterized protein n=1 Tax=Puccinia sorghi TaxID=27349 RepID=A0A0L6VID0_9BASI|nr:hypothetical protein VP01_1653g7 [Puccinia sorghi]